MKAAIYGYGNIGNGIAVILEKNADLIEKKVGEKVELKSVLDIRDFEGDPIQEKIVHDVNDIVNDPEISIVCETMGGDEPAYTFTKMALEAGKSVCTSNKVVVANHGAELIRIAKEHNCNYFFEASVGGGIPIIRTMNTALCQEHIQSVIGIVNGTTNFMLTKMAKEGASYDEVLKEAQDKGYAERNPEADVEGHDACRKIAILSSLAIGKTVNYEDIYTEGITKLTKEDFAYAKKLDSSIKLLAMSKVTEQGTFAMVAPFMLGESHPLFGVNDVFNAVFVRSDMLDDSMYYGRGAGKLPTASAVVADIVEAARFPGETLPVSWSEEKAEKPDYSASEKQFFVRLDKALCPQEKAESVFGAGEVVVLEELPSEYGFLTGVLSEKAFAEKAENLEGFISRIRVEK